LLNNCPDRIEPWQSLALDAGRPRLKCLRRKKKSGGRVGFEHFGRSMRISMLPILQSTSFPRNPLRSPYFPPDLPPPCSIRFDPAKVGCEHAEIPAKVITKGIYAVRITTNSLCSISNDFANCQMGGAMALTRFHTSSDIAFLQTMQSFRLLFNPTKSTTSRSPSAQRAKSSDVIFGRGASVPMAPVQIGGDRR
jgi:hypothetical protein